jgi:hypothetical protein
MKSVLVRLINLDMAHTPTSQVEKVWVKKDETCWFVIGCILLDKITSLYWCYLTGIPLFISVSRRFCTVCKSENSVPCQPFGWRVIPSGRPAIQSTSRLDDVSYRPDAHQTKASFVRTTWIPVRTFLCVEKLRTVLAYIRPDDSAARPDDPQCSIKLQDFFPKHRYGKIAATVRMTWISVRAHSSIRQVSQFKSRRPEASHHGPDRRVSNMKIACITSTFRTTILPIQTRKASVWKLLAANVRPSGRQGDTIWTRFSNRKDIQQNFQSFDRTVVCPNGLWPPSGRHPVLSSQMLIWTVSL